MIWNYLSVETAQFGFTKIKGAKINLHTNSPSFGAAKLMGLQYHSCDYWKFPLIEQCQTWFVLMHLLLLSMYAGSGESLSSTSAKNYQNRLMCIEVIVCRIGVVFWDAVYFIWSGMWIINPISLPQGSVLAFWFKHWVCFLVFFCLLSGVDLGGWLVTPMAWQPILCYYYACDLTHKRSNFIVP